MEENNVVVNELDTVNLDIDREAIKKKTINVFLVNIFILAYILITEIMNVNYLLSSKDGITNLIGIIALMIIPFTIVAVIEKIVALILVKVNKWKDKVCLIITLVMEIVSFFTLNKIVIVFMVLNFMKDGKAISTLLSIVIEGLSIYLIILLVKGLKLTNKKEKINKKDEVVEEVKEIEMLDDKTE